MLVAPWSSYERKMAQGIHIGVALALMYVTVASTSIRVHLLIKLSGRDHC